MKIRSMGAELFQALVQTDMTLVVAFRNFANAPKNKIIDYRGNVKQIKFTSLSALKVIGKIGNIL
jgi:hypothetical protein